MTLSGERTKEWILKDWNDIDKTDKTTIITITTIQIELINMI